MVGKRVVGRPGIRERMVPAALYQRIWADQTLGEAATTLLSVQMHCMSDDDTDRGRRALLVFERDGRFLGLLRAGDILRAVVSGRRASRRPPSGVGALEAAAGAAARLPVRRVVRPAPSVDVNRSVLTAANLIVSRRLSHLAVMRRGRLIGLLRAEDLYQDIASR